MPAPRLTVLRETFPIRGSFRISRGAKTEAAVVVAEVIDGPHRGRGECVPYARYGESVEGVAAALEAMAGAVAGGLDRAGLAAAMPAGAARNALDCALWDLEAKRSGVPVWRAAGLAAAPGPLTTCYTLSVDEPEAMAAVARERVARHPLLKMKLTGEGDLDRVRAVRAAAPAARLVVDANEGWTLDQLDRFAPVLAGLGVEMIEQPLPAGQDEALRGVRGPVPLGADESCHGPESLERLRGLYAVVNVKLDKTGGLTDALAMKRAAEAMGFDVMVGCMVATSLAMAPAMLVGQGARYVDLDGPLLLAEDRAPGLVYDGAAVQPPRPELWG
ncbi:N-acetyl-D-Glu racemase DgcA [Azospirillum doebereinerae]|uniref:Dipeptide epimerase n=1 Tax=Azospirillum doebereinerae TaxID=92933 RepID=A0A3S0WP47_9PROT|nr:N-acetyl-D-Glu racemase DgcA [Azospirillum doebereinerae]RUQ74967.1 dipeptide epimerase [Azospirillum doebereinerae]